MRATPAKPAGATIVQPVTEAARTATALLLTWVADLVDTSNENAERAEASRKALCDRAAPD